MLRWLSLQQQTKGGDPVSHCLPPRSPAQHDLDACLLRGQRRLATLEAVQSDRGSTMEGLLPKGGGPSLLASRRGAHSRLPPSHDEPTLRAPRVACNYLGNRHEVGFIVSVQTAVVVGVGSSAGPSLRPRAKTGCSRLTTLPTPTGPCTASRAAPGRTSSTSDLLRRPSEATLMPHCTRNHASSLSTVSRLGLVP